MPKHPIAEVFGFPCDNLTLEAQRYRKNRLCPFGNKVANCTKDKARDPLGVCSVLHQSEVVITCPIRFRQAWLIAEDAANFLFGKKANWTTLTEVRLADNLGKSAGNIDVVLASYNDGGQVLDFGALEIQAVYISGNIRQPFKYYMKDPKKHAQMDWTKRPNYPRPDYLSSSRKRLAPQLMFKGGILNQWNKKICVALNKSFFHTLPELTQVRREDADIAWLIYDLKLDNKTNKYNLSRDKEVFTKFEDSLLKITQTQSGDINRFIKLLQSKVDKKLNGNNKSGGPESNHATI